MKKLTNEQNHFHQTSPVCHICEEEFLPTDKRCRDHDHITGEYRGPAHNNCNLLYRINPKNIKIPCVIHNLKGYDSHLILNAVKRRHGDISVIPTNTEKYISFTVGQVTYMDSNQFMMSKLETLVENLDDNKFYETRKYLEMMYGGKKTFIVCFIYRYRKDI